MNIDAQESSLEERHKRDHPAQSCAWASTQPIAAVNGELDVPADLRQAATVTAWALRK